MVIDHYTHTHTNTQFDPVEPTHGAENPAESGESQRPQPDILIPELSEHECCKAPNRGRGKGRMAADTSQCIHKTHHTHTQQMNCAPSVRMYPGGISSSPLAPAPAIAPGAPGI